MNFKDLRNLNQERCKQAYHPIEEWSPTDWATACAGEMGEACNLIKKARRISADPEEWPLGHRALIGEELADTVIYIDLLCKRLNLVLEDCIRRKFNITSDQVGSNIKL